MWQASHPSARLSPSRLWSLQLTSRRKITVKDKPIDWNASSHSSCDNSTTFTLHSSACLSVFLFRGNIFKTLVQQQQQQSSVNHVFNQLIEGQPIDSLKKNELHFHLFDHILHNKSNNLWCKRGTKCSSHWSFMAIQSKYLGLGWLSQLYHGYNIRRRKIHQSGWN